MVGVSSTVQYFVYKLERNFVLSYSIIQYSSPVNVEPIRILLHSYPRPAPAPVTAL
jgi:hypothetical protein